MVFFCFLSRGLFRYFFPCVYMVVLSTCNRKWGWCWWLWWWLWDGLTSTFTRFNPLLRHEVNIRAKWQVTYPYYTRHSRTYSPLDAFPLLLVLVAASLFARLDVDLARKIAQGKEVHDNHLKGKNWIDELRSVSLFDNIKKIQKRWNRRSLSIC